MTHINSPKNKIYTNNINSRKVKEIDFFEKIHGGKNCSDDEEDVSKYLDCIGEFIFNANFESIAENTSSNNIDICINNLQSGEKCLINLNTTSFDDKNIILSIFALGTKLDNLFATNVINDNTTNLLDAVKDYINKSIQILVERRIYNKNVYSLLHSLKAKYLQFKNLQTVNEIYNKVVDNKVKPLGVDIIKD